MKLKLFNRRQDHEPPVDSVAETAFIQESLKKCFFLSNHNDLNLEQINNDDYEQYRSENERNYATYGRNSVEEGEQSDFVHANVLYGQTTVQDSFFRISYVVTWYQFQIWNIEHNRKLNQADIIWSLWSNWFPAAQQSKLRVRLLFSSE